MTDLPAQLDRFPPITLDEMDGVKLQDRVDTKYVFGLATLPAVLDEMLPHYRLLEVDGVRGSHYRSLYFDTPGLRDYRDHHNGRTLRRKVRFREYLGSGLCYLEVKRKTGSGRTGPSPRTWPANRPPSWPTHHEARKRWSRCYGTGSHGSPSSIASVPSASPSTWACASACSMTLHTRSLSAASWWPS